jgi:hypothetical protein
MERQYQRLLASGAAVATHICSRGLLLQLIQSCADQELRYAHTMNTLAAAWQQENTVSVAHVTKTNEAIAMGPAAPTINKNTADR